MLFTDPPWNVAINGGKSTGDSLVRAGKRAKPQKTILNDDLGADFAKFAAEFVRSFAASCEPGTPVYIAMSSREWPLVDDLLRRAGFHWSSTIIWVKDALVLSRKDFHPRFEPFWYGWRDGAPRRKAVEDRKLSDVWEFDRPRRSDIHPTMKPVALVARALQASSKRGDVVLEPFCGSGATMIACQQLGRRCAAIELDPKYADVIVERWQNFTGKKARRE